MPTQLSFSSKAIDVISSVAADDWIVIFDAVRCLWRQGASRLVSSSVVNKDLSFNAKAKAKDSKFVLEDSSRSRTEAKDNNIGFQLSQTFTRLT